MKMTKNPRVVDLNPYFSTKIPERVGPRKFPKKNELDHISKIETEMNNMLDSIVQHYTH